MCLIRTGNDLDEEVNVPARVISQRVPQSRQRSASRRRTRSRSRSSSSSSSESESHASTARRSSRHGHASARPPPRSMPPPSVVQEVDIYEDRQVSRVPYPPRRSPRQSANVVTVHVDRSPRESRGDQIAVVRTRDYARERERDRDEGPSYRYVQPRRESMRGMEEDFGRSSRRSGSLTYAVNPRTSTASHRSARERIVVQDYDGRRREYYK